MESSAFIRVAELVVDIPTRALDGSFSYLVPDGLDVSVGQCVELEFGHRPAIAYVMHVSERLPREFGDIHLRPIKQVLSEPFFDEIGAALALWISKEYISTLPEAVRLLMPPGALPRMRKNKANVWEYVAPKISEVDDRWVMLTKEGKNYVAPKRATRQAAVIEALSAGEMRVAELGIEIGSVSSVLKTLESKGIVHIEHRRRIRGTTALPKQSYDIKSLTPGQSEALSAIDEACKAGRGDVIVLDGVTGSGKTEVYLQAIRHVLESGRSACVLVPEISLTPQTVGRFRSRFGDLVAVLHSRLSDGERYDQWTLLRDGTARLVVGARSALFAPMKDLGLIVIDEEHESTYKQGSSPRYSTRDVAERLAKMRGAALVLGSASPSIETLHRCSTGQYKRVILPERAAGRPLPPVEIVDLGAEFAAGNRSMLSRTLSKALIETIDKQEKAVLLLNRRGFASFLLCRECGFVPECDQCSTSMTFHEGRRGYEGFLMCHHCGSHKPIVARCPNCGSPYLRQLGPGTQFAHDQLRALLGPDVPIIRMDADTTKTKGAHESLLNEFASADGGVLLGTQMIAKGLDFPDVTLVGVLIADTTLKIPDFRAAERTFQLLEQVAGRAGRAERDGRVIVQTYWPTHPAIRAAASHNREMFLEGELPARLEFGWPPYKRLANILLWGEVERDVANSAMALRKELEARLAEFASAEQSLGSVATNSAVSNNGGARCTDASQVKFELVGPSPCLLARLRGTYRWHLLVKGPIGSDLPALIAPVIRSYGTNSKVSVAVDVDPVDLF